MSRDGAKIGSDGLNTRERAIMDLWDTGLGSKAIGRELHLDDTAVRKIVVTFSDSKSELRSDNRTRAASQRLVAAIAATGKCFA